MGEILRSDLAELDLLEIWEFIAEDSEAAADRFLDLLGKKCELLAEFPMMGPSREASGAWSSVFPFPTLHHLLQTC